LGLAARGDSRALAAALASEEEAERQADARYWAPLRAELARLRAQRRG